MSDQKREYKKAIVFDIDGVINQPGISVKEVKGGAQKAETRINTKNRTHTFAVLSEKANKQVNFYDQYATNDENLNIFHLNLLKWFFQTLEENKIKSLFGSQYAAYIKPPQNKEIKPKEQKRAGRLLEGLNNIFGENRKFLTSNDISLMSDHLTDLAERNDPTWDELNTNKSKQALIGYAKKEFGSAYIVDDNNYIIGSALTSGDTDSIYVSGNEYLAPLFILDVLFQELSVEEIRKSMLKMKSQDLQNFKALIELYELNSHIDEKPKRPENSKIESANYQNYQCRLRLWEKRQYHVEKLQHLKLLINQFKQDFKSDVAKKPFSSKPFKESNTKLSARVLAFFPVSLGELLLRSVLKLSGTPENPVFKTAFNFLSLVFWPQRLVDQYPKYEAAFRVANLLILTAVIMFAFPPLAGALAGVFGGGAALSAAIAYLPQAFNLTNVVTAAQVFFGMVGVVYAVLFQAFNKSKSPIVILDGKIKTQIHSSATSTGSISSKEDSRNSSTPSPDPRSERSVSVSASKDENSRRPSPSTSGSGSFQQLMSPNTSSSSTFTAPETIHGEVGTEDR